jgi:hypothetical protein
MNYALLLGDVKECSKDKLKEIIFELDQMDYQSIKELNVSDEAKKELIVMMKNRTFFEMLLVNALK